MRASAIRPRVLQPLKPDVASVVGEALGDGVIALCVLRAVQASPRQQTCELRDPDAEHLLRQDVVYARLQVRYLLCQPHGQAAGYLSQEYSGLRTRVEK